MGTAVVVGGVAGGCAEATTQLGTGVNGMAL